MRQLLFALFLLFSRQAMAVAMPTDTPSLTPTISPTFSPSPTATPVCALGDVTVYNTSTTMIKDTIFSEHFTVPQAVQLTALRFNQRYCYHNPIYIGIYQGTASDPSFLLGQTSAYTGSGGAEVYDQSVFNLPDINLQPGVDYWLAFVIGGSGSDEIFTGSYGMGAEDLWNNSYTAGPLPTGTYDKGSGGGSGVNVGVQYIFCGYVDGTATPTYTVTTTSTATPSPTPTVTVTRVCQQGTITSWGTFLPVEKDNIVFQHFTVPSAQQLTAIQFPLNSASGGNYSIGIYQGSSTSPSTLIGQVSGTWPVGGTYYTVNLPDMDLNPGSDYWWAILSGAATNPLLYYGLDPDLAYHVPYGAGPLPHYLCSPMLAV
jgi:hypothetical protein